MNLTELWEKLKNKTTDTIVDIGDMLQYGLPFAALFVIATNPTLGLAYKWLYAIFGQAIASTSLKKIFNFTPLGTRPNGGENSMPSGHTTAAFAGATLVALAGGWLPGLIALPFAVFTGYSRVRGNAHHWRDVGAGAVLGTGVALGFFKYEWASYITGLFGMIF
jgi:membrane-associated phospholipid phosphatase